MTALRTTLLASFTVALGWLAVGPAVWSAPPTLKAKSASNKTPAPPATLDRNPLAVAAVIDREIDRKLAEANMASSPVCDDAEFIRRLSLDICGRIPAPERVATFLADRDPAKRRKLIDEFLADKEYGEHFGIVWYHRMAKPDMCNGNLLSAKFMDWLAEQFNANRGWDAIVRDVLTAEGDRDKDPAIVFWLANVEGDKKRVVAPNKVTAAATHLFLGVRLECCECHNHPFDKMYKQTDFWSLAAFFTATHCVNADKKSGGTPAIREGASVAGKGRRRMVRSDAPAGSIAIPDTKGKTVRATFLKGEAPKLAGVAKPRAVFASWATNKHNPYFAPAAVNKLWANFFGQGLVNPIDDMRSDAKGVHPELLAALANEFRDAEFDQKHLIRCICNSKTYQRTSKPLPENKDDEELFSHMRLKAMTADRLFDSLRVALDHDPASKAERRVKGAVKGKARGGPRDEFRAYFHAEADDDAGVVEEYAHGVPQVLRLMNSLELNNTAAVVARLIKAHPTSPDKVVEGLYLRTLSRKPTLAETARRGSMPAAAGRTRPSGRVSPPSFGTPGDGVEDLRVPGATAQVPRQCFADLVVRGLRAAPQEIDRRHDEAGRAEAALYGPRIDECLLHGVQFFAVAEALHRRHLVSVRLRGEHEAGTDEDAVEQHRARSALALLAGVL